MHFKKFSFKNVGEVAQWRLCLGCGACAYACREDKIKLFDIAEEGIRPIIKDDPCPSCDDCLKVCPGIDTGVYRDKLGRAASEVLQNWGPVLEIWEGYAADQTVRHDASSGGAVTAIARYCIEREGMSVLHIGAENGSAYKNRTYLSKNAEELIARTGSRYSPASPCDSLGEIENSQNASVFIGKPCDVVALRKAHSIRPRLRERTGIAISIFCAGTPSTKGTLDLLATLKIAPERVEEIRYRGKGWPGKTTVRTAGCSFPTAGISYSEAWGFLQRYRQFRCYLCPDGTGESADISCGDPWHRVNEEKASGYSLILVRTEKGREVLQKAIKAGYIEAWQSGPKALGESQRNLLKKKEALWGRLFAMRALAIPVPVFTGFELKQLWLRLSIKKRMTSILGTVRRLIQRRQFRKDKTYIVACSQK